MTESIWPEQTGHYLVLGETGSGKSRLLNDLMASVLKDIAQKPARLPDHRQHPKKTDNNDRR